MSRDGGLTARKTLTQVIRRRVNPPVSICVFLFLSSCLCSFYYSTAPKEDALGDPGLGMQPLTPGSGEPSLTHDQQGLLSQMG